MTIGGHILAANDPMQHVLPHGVRRLFEFDFEPWEWMFLRLSNQLWLTNHMIMIAITAAIMVAVFPLLARNYPLVPTGLRNFFEGGLEFVREGIARPALHEHTDRFIPYIWTMFFFILINNLLGMVPLDAFAQVALSKSHLFGTATAGISITAALAFLTFVVIHVSGYRAQVRHLIEHGQSGGAAAVVGAVTYLKSLVPHVPGVAGVVLFPLLLVLELIGALVKPFSLAIRLFANMMAGHIVLASLLMMVPAIHGMSALGVAVPTILGSVALSCLEVFVALLQAYIFTFLSCMFIGAAINPEH